MAGDSATGDFHTHFKHLFFLDLDHACTPSPAHPHSLCARLPFPVLPRPLSPAAKAQSVPIWEGVLVSACPGRREEAGRPFSCSAHPTACGARLLQLSRDALHPPHVHLWGRRVQERDSRVSGFRGVYRQVWHRSALAAQPRGVRGAGAGAAAAAGRERRLGCRCGSGRRGALWALRGDGRRGRAGGGWWRGLEGGRGGKRMPGSHSPRARSPLPSPPATEAPGWGAGAVALAMEHWDPKEDWRRLRAEQGPLWELPAGYQRRLEDPYLLRTAPESGGGEVPDPEPQQRTPLGTQIPTGLKCGCTKLGCVQRTPEGRRKEMPFSGTGQGARNS